MSVEYWSSFAASLIGIILWSSTLLLGFLWSRQTALSLQPATFWVCSGDDYIESYAMGVACFIEWKRLTSSPVTPPLLILSSLIRSPHSWMSWEIDRSSSSGFSFLPTVVLESYCIPPISFWGASPWCKCSWLYGLRPLALRVVSTHLESVFPIYWITVLPWLRRAEVSFIDCWSKTWSYSIDNVQSRGTVKTTLSHMRVNVVGWRTFSLSPNFESNELLEELRP